MPLSALKSVRIHRKFSLMIFLMIFRNYNFCIYKHLGIVFKVLKLFICCKFQNVFN